jgi:hypothetical protein
VCVRVLVAADGGYEINALFNWLRQDRRLNRHSVISPRRPDEATGLSALDVIDVVLTHLTAITSLALAIVAWRQSRPRSGPVTITRPDGRSMTVDGPPERAAELIVAFLNEDSSGRAANREPRDEA